MFAAHLSTHAGALATIECDLGRYDKAAPLAEESSLLGAPDDVATQVIWRGAKGRVLAHSGSLEAGERLAREAVRLAEQTDALLFQGDALMELADVLRMAGKESKAREAVMAALALYEQKGSVALAKKARTLVEELTAEPLAERD